MTHVRHLRPIEPETVEALYHRIRTFPLPMGIRMELDAFRANGTPWDGRRLANALHMFKLAPEIVMELDALVLEKGGLGKDHTRGNRRD